MGLFEPTHLIVILLIVLVLFGGTKIPQLMKGVGQGLGEFQKGLDETKRTMKKHVDEATTTTPTESESEPAKSETPKEL